MIWLPKSFWRRLDLPSSLVLLHWQHSFLEPLMCRGLWRLYLIDDCWHGNTDDVTRETKKTNLKKISFFDCSRHGDVMIAVLYLVPQLNDPAIPTAIGAQVGTNIISHIVSGCHETLSVSQPQILQTPITTISSSSVKPTSPVEPATSPLTPREIMYRCIYLCLVLVGYVCTQAEYSAISPFYGPMTGRIPDCQPQQPRLFLAQWNLFFRKKNNDNLF
jgi:hypothetical protein